MKSRHIVLIEDNPVDVFLVEKALAKAGIDCTLTHFTNGNEAVRVLCAHQDGAPVPDAILLDLNTPWSDGFEALLRLQQAPRLANVPIAILTGSNDHTDKHRAAVHGARYIEKPIGMQEFFDTVGKAVKEMLTAG